MLIIRDSQNRKKPFHIDIMTVWLQRMRCNVYLTENPNHHESFSTVLHVFLLFITVRTRSLLAGGYLYYR